MGIKRRIIKITKNIKNKFLRIFKTEEELFYENFFTINPYWSSKNPNEDELSRWNAINKFIEVNIGFSENFNILDVGCGRGWLSNLLTKYGNVTGIEPVKKVVQYAKKLYPNVEFKVGSTQNLLPKFKNNFDLIVCSEVLEHIPDDKKAIFISEISLLLKSKGYAIFSTPRADIQEEWMSFTEPGQPIEDWISEANLEKLFIQVGFKTIALERVSIAPKQNIDPLPIYQVWLFRKE